MNIQISLNFQCLNCFNHPPTTRTSFSRLPPPIAWIHIPTASMVVQSLVPPKPVETWAFDHSVWNLASDHSKSAHVDGSEIAANHATWILKACKITGEIYPSSTGDRRISSWRYKIDVRDGCLCNGMLTAWSHGFESHCPLLDTFWCCYVGTVLCVSS